MNSNPALLAANDGLHFDEVGAWAEDKHSLVALYNKLFSTGMRKKWDLRVYADLYSGPGLLKIRNSNRFIWGSPLLALGLPDPFDKYVFCEENVASMKALKQRVKNRFPEASVAFVQGSCDQKIDEILSHIPSGSRSCRVLTSCFLDPFDLSLKFSAVAKLATRRIDFLILLALQMDGNRAKTYYMNRRNRKVDEFLGLNDWREAWEKLKEPKNFPRFLAEMYAKQMKSLGYLQVGFEDMKQVRSDETNAPLYRLALFSRSNMALKFWKEALKYSTPQKDFGFLY